MLVYEIPCYRKQLAYYYFYNYWKKNTITVIIIATVGRRCYNAVKNLGNALMVPIYNSDNIGYRSEFRNLTAKNQSKFTFIIYMMCKTCTKSHTTLFCQQKSNQTTRGKPFSLHTARIICDRESTTLSCHDNDRCINNVIFLFFFSSVRELSG